MIDFETNIEQRHEGAPSKNDFGALLEPLEFRTSFRYRNLASGWYAGSASRPTFTRRRVQETDSTVHCHVYASGKRQQTYVWLVERDGFDVLPEALAQRLGELRFVLDVQLDAKRDLPNADAGRVLEQLATQGWYLQLPPDAEDTSNARSRVDGKG